MSFIAPEHIFQNLSITRSFSFLGTRGVLLLTVCLAQCVTGAQAQDLEPRSYTNIPIGMNFMVLGYAHSQGEVSPSPGAPVENVQLNIDAAAIGYAHSFSLGGRSSKIDMGVSRVCFDGSAILAGETITADRCGYTDPSIRLTWNFFGAPALSLKEFVSWDQGVVIGTSLQVTVPIGSYDEKRLLNAGTNRWVFRPGIGMSQKLGRWYYNLIASARIYADNDEYFNDVSLQQEPQYTLQGHLIYSIGPGHWLSINSNYFFGGETTKGNIEFNDYQENSRFGLTYSIPLSRHHSIKLNYSKGVLTRVGNDFDSFGAFWLYNF